MEIIYSHIKKYKYSYYNEIKEEKHYSSLCVPDVYPLLFLCRKKWLKNNNHSECEMKKKMSASDKTHKF